METPDNIKKIVENYQNIYCEEQTIYNQFKEAYNFLVRKKKENCKLEQIEFKFLFWLNYNNSKDFPITFNKPYIPEIIELPYHEFREQYVTNEKKLNIFYALKEFLLEKFNHEVFLDLLIGGSFLEKNNSAPKDIDCIILLTEQIISSNTWLYDDITTRQEKYATDIVDAHYLPNNYSFTNPNAYVNIMMLGNKPAIKDTQQRLIENNIFEKRNVIKVRFPNSTSKPD